MALPRKILIEHVLALWRSGQHDTHAIAALVKIDEREVCEIIEQRGGK